MKVGMQLTIDRLGLVTICSIESWHTIVVFDAKGNYYRVSGLGA